MTEDGLGAYLRRVRDMRGYSLREVESRCRISNGNLSLIEHGNVKKPSPQTLFALATCYELDYLDLMRRAGYPVPDREHAPPTTPVAFMGFERLTPEGKSEVEEFIKFKLRQQDQQK